MSREYERRTAGRGAAGDAAAAAAVPGKQTRVDLVARAIAGGGTALPYATAIQRAFGHHDVSGVRAHLGPTAVAAAAALGAEAFAAGEHVVIGGAADLRTVAHEAAHVIQQRAGVAAETDAYERHADEVAAAVVEGRSAEALLDQVAAPGARASAEPGATVQRIKKEDLIARGKRIAAIADQMPQRGINLFVARNDKLDAEIHLLGTAHAQPLTQMGGDDASLRHYLVDYLQTTAFTHVFSETGDTSGNQITVQKNLAAALDKQRELEAARARTQDGTMARMHADQKITNHEANLGNIHRYGLDSAYVQLAGSTPSGGSKLIPNKPGALETPGRETAREQNRRDLNITKEDPESAYQVTRRPNEAVNDNAAIFRGDQRAQFREVADELTSGRDIADAEERNREWVARIAEHDLVAPHDRQLWIVGAGHLAGLMLRFQDLGWTVTHRDPPQPAAQIPAAAQPQPQAQAQSTSIEDVD